MGKSAVIGWGRGMGHTGHDELVKATIHQARKTGATPFFIVSKSFGEDDPIPPQTKLEMYKKKFPEYVKIFSVATDDKPSINDQLALVASKGFKDGTLVVGADQKDAFGYMTRPNKSGVEPYKKFGFDTFNVMSRQETGLPSSNPKSPDYHEGPRATPMRDVLTSVDTFKQNHPKYAKKFEKVSDSDLPFAVWRDAMSKDLSDDEVLVMMLTAKENLLAFKKEKELKKNKKKPKGRKLKEFIDRIKPMLPYATIEQKEKIYQMIREHMSASKSVIQENSARIAEIKNIVKKSNMSESKDFISEK